MKPVYWLLGIALFGGLFVGAWQFATQNSTTVDVYYITGTLTEVALGKALASSFVLGASLTALAASYSYLKSKLLLRSYRKTTKRLENEIHQLRNLPIENEPTLSAGDAAISGGSSTQPMEQVS